MASKSATEGHHALQGHPVATGAWAGPPLVASSIIPTSKWPAPGCTAPIKRRRPRTLIGRAPIGISGTNDVEALLASTRTASSTALHGRPQVVAASWLRQERRDPLAGSTRRPPSDEIRCHCEAGGVTLHGTGIHPEGSPSASRSWFGPVGLNHHVRAEEFSDIRTYGAPDVVRDWMLFGKTPIKRARAS